MTLEERGGTLVIKDSEGYRIATVEEIERMNNVGVYVGNELVAKFDDIFTAVKYVENAKLKNYRIDDVKEEQ